MHSTLPPKQTDPYADPHDDVLVARIDEELSSPAPDAARYPSDPQTHIAPDFYAGAAVPPVDTTFRPTVNDVRGRRPSIGKRALRAVTAFLLAGCIGAAAIASQSYGTVAKQMIGKWTPKFLLMASPPLENTGLAQQPSAPAVQANAAQEAPTQPAPPAQTAAESVAPTAAAPSPEQAQLLQSMARDLAAARQEIDQLKASQQQMSRDIARVSEAKSSEAKSSETRAYEQNLRPKTPARISALPPRPLAAPARRPMPSYPPPQAAAAPPPLPPPAAPYVPRQPEPLPQTTADPQADPELSPPRPPMPVR